MTIEGWAGHCLLALLPGMGRRSPQGVLPPSCRPLLVVLALVSLPVLAAAGVAGCLAVRAGGSIRFTGASGVSGAACQWSGLGG